MDLVSGRPSPGGLRQLPVHPPSLAALTEREQGEGRDGSSGKLEMLSPEGQWVLDGCTHVLHALLSLLAEEQPPSLDLCACSPSLPIQLEGEVGGGKEVDGPETREGWRISQPAQGRASGSQRPAHTSPCGARHWEAGTDFPY